MKVHYSFLQPVSIFLPCHLVHSRRCPPFQTVVAAAEQFDIDMVQQGGEPHLRVPFSCLTYTVQPAWPVFPARCPVRVRLFRILLGQRPSLHDLLGPSLAFVRSFRQYYAAVRLPIAVRVGLIAHRLLPPIRSLLAANGNRVSRFSRVKFPCMRGVYDSAGPASALAFSRATVLPFRLA